MCIRDSPEGYKELSFVCLRPDGAFEAPSTVGIMCRTARKKVEMCIRDRYICFLLLTHRQEPPQEFSLFANLLIAYINSLLRFSFLYIVYTGKVRIYKSGKTLHLCGIFGILKT